MSLPALRSTSPLSRWNPLRELDDIQQRMQQLMSSVIGSPAPLDAALWTPLADVSETEDAYLVEVDVPGVKREDIEVQAAGNELTITGEFKEHERAGQLRSRARRSGHFEYRTVLPSDTDAENISAELAEGVLAVRVPKSETAKPKRIEVTERHEAITG